MPDDEIPFKYGGRKLFRRKRASVGETWQPTHILDVHTKDKGMYCRDCRKRVLYKDLECQYEMRSGDVFRLWVCVCGSVLQQDNLTDLSIVYDQNKENRFD